MLDYKGIEALYTVQELQSFEAAAKKLHITQSAISQRIKSLEIYYGEPLLIRTLPYRLTPLGKQLTSYFKRVCLLEEDFEKQLKKTSELCSISIALNRDSLETWFLELIENTEIFKDVLLNVIADDQELTLDYLKNGLVSACLSTSEKEILGGKMHFLGNMNYILVASPSFAKKYFSKGSPKECLSHAPMMKFDQHDQLNERYLEKFFGLNGKDLPCHTLPSVKGFKKFALLGYAYGLIPKIDVLEELKKKQLIQLYDDKTWKIPLYWHYWAIESEFYKKFNADIIHYASKALKTLL